MKAFVSTGDRDAGGRTGIGGGRASSEDEKWRSGGLTGLGGGPPPLDGRGAGGRDGKPTESFCGSSGSLLVLNPLVVSI